MYAGDFGPRFEGEGLAVVRVSRWWFPALSCRPPKADADAGNADAVSCILADGIGFQPRHDAHSLEIFGIR
jgi:hypothetical protein